MSYRISIDPGSTAIGVAVWVNPIKHNKLPIWCGNLYPEKDTKDLDVFRKIDSLMKKFETQVVDEFEYITDCYCEIPTYFESNRGQHVAASGDLIKLTLSVGSIMEFCRNWGIEFCPIRVIDWRGQLPESVMQSRVKELLGPELLQALNPKSHSFDAIGIGHYGITGEAI
jgi:hypothetical protein